MDNLAGLEEELVVLEEGDRGVRRDKVLLELVADVLDGLIREALSHKWSWESLLAGEDREREIIRRKGLHNLGVMRGLEYCVWCGEQVGPGDWAVGRLCGHQVHMVSESN